MVSRPGLLSDRGELEALFDELAAELRRLGVAGEVVMVGGAWLLWHAQRVATRDVDSARRLDPQLTDAIDAVGQRHDLRSGWLNDAAAAFWPAGASFDDCAVVYEHESLVVRAPAPEVVFVMPKTRPPYPPYPPELREQLVAMVRAGRSPEGLAGTTSPRPPRSATGSRRPTSMPVSPKGSRAPSAALFGLPGSIRAPGSRSGAGYPWRR